MINVNTATKNAWASGTIDRFIKITVGNTTIINKDIAEKSLSVSQSIIHSDSLEFVGCIPSKCQFRTNAFNDTNLKGLPCSVQVRAGTTEWITIFTGEIDESKKAGIQGYKEITAYDALYRLSQTDATDWYNSISPMDLSHTLSKFFEDFNLPSDPNKLGLVNANLMVYGSSQRQVKKLTGLDFLKQVCQINGCIGYIDGSGRFGIRYIDATVQACLYPASSLFPSNRIYPSNSKSGSSGSDVTQIPYYQSLSYEDYTIKTIDKVNIRKTSEELGVFYPAAGNNTYIIQGNLFALDQSSSVLLDCCERIYNVVNKASFRPFTAKQNGYPWIECGDKLVYYDIDDEGEQIEVGLAIMARTFTGDQMVWDTFSADGEQDQQIFITDLKAQLEDLQNQIDDIKETPDGSLSAVVMVEYTTPIEAPTLGAYDRSISGIVTEV